MQRNWSYLPSAVRSVSGQRPFRSSPSLEEKITSVVCYAESNPFSNLGFSSMKLDVDSTLYVMLNENCSPL